MITINTLQRINELAASASQSPVIVPGNLLQDLFPADPAIENQLLHLGLIGHKPLKRSTEDKIEQFCQKKGITYRAYHRNSHYVFFRNAA